MAEPSVDALNAVLHTWGYLKAAKHWTLSARLASVSESDPQLDHRMYSDSDYAANAEIQNERRSQLGCVFTVGGAPYHWASKVQSNCNAAEDLEAHPELSVAASEVYAAGNATQDAMYLSYVADEMGVVFPKPFVLHIDNTSAVVFSDATALRTKLRHIDVRQCWIRSLRNKSVVITKYVKSADNLADFLTKIQKSTAVFESLRERLMVWKVFESTS
jgi:hypothetical protein